MKKPLHYLRRASKTRTTPGHRFMRFESLETREFLAVAAGGIRAEAVSALDSSALYAESSLCDAAVLPIAAAQPTGTVPLSAPIITGVTGGGKTSHIISWGAVENASTYRLAYSTNGADWTDIDTTSLSVTLPDLICGNNMKYRVRALGHGDYAASSWSAVRSFYVCPVDVDGDGFVGPGDFAMMSSAWFTSSGSTAWNAACDLDGDGFVGPGDFAVISSVWFATRDRIAITSLDLFYDGEDLFLSGTEGAGAVLRVGDVISVADSKDGPYASITLRHSWNCYFIDSAMEPGDYQFYVKVSRPGSLYDWEDAITFVVEEPEVRPEDVTVSLEWDSINHGLALTWTAKNEFRNDAIIDLYFSRAAEFDGIVDDAAVSITLPAGTTAGQSNTILIAGMELYTEVPSDTFDTIIACLNHHVLTSIQDVSLVIGSGVNTSVVNQTTYDAIKYGCRAVGLNSLRLTSGWRTPEQQARAMFYNMARSDVRGAIAYQYSLYGWAGDQVISVFEQQAILYDYNQSTLLAHSAEIIGLMTDKINELDAEGIRVSRHCVSEEVYRAHNIIDVSRAPFNASNIPKFTDAVKQMGATKVLDEPANGCLHIEF
jgi:hypothetical protein